MPYTKTTWIDRSVQYPSRFTRTSDGTYDTLVPAPGTITNSGTPLTANALNNLETQYDQAMADVAAAYVKKQTLSWIQASLYNGWTYYGQGAVPSYYKNELGMVFIKGLVKGGTGNGSGIFTLPAGYRPGDNKICMVFDGANAAKRIDIQTNGIVIVPTGWSVNNSYLTLDLPPFIAEN